MQLYTYILITLHYYRYIIYAIGSLLIDTTTVVGILLKNKTELRIKIDILINTKFQTRTSYSEILMYSNTSEGTHRSSVVVIREAPPPPSGP